MTNLCKEEKIGNALNILEALNNMLLLRITKRNYKAIRKVFIHNKIQLAINFIEEVSL